MEYNVQAKLNKWRVFACNKADEVLRLQDERTVLRAENDRLREALEKLYDDKGDMIAPNWVRLVAKEALK